MSEKTDPRETKKTAPETPQPVTSKDETPSKEEEYTFRDWASI